MTDVPRRVLVLCGPSGAGKSRLADRLNAEHHWPVVRLDDFYRDVGEPGLPMTDMGIPDWDDVGTFDLDGAVAALDELCRTGHAQVPEYDISASRRTGVRDVDASGARLVVAEGIFAAHAVAPLTERGLLARAYCIRQGPWVTFARRLARDLAERRKPPWVLLRRGLRLRRDEPRVVAEHESFGAVAMTPPQAQARARGLVGSNG